MKQIKIGSKILGSDKPTYIIAEIGSNFDGSFEKAKKLVDLAKDSGADCAKFQSFLTDKLLSEKGFEKSRSFQSKWKKPVWQVYRDAEFPRNWHEKLAKYAKKRKIDFMSTPYDYEAVDLLDSIGIPAFKIGSGDITYLQFLKYIARKNKPILLPTGASSIQEIKQAINAIKSTNNNKIILMQSVTQYPSPLEDSNVKAMIKMGDQFKLNYGYSDHTAGIVVPLTSVALGACIIEKHFTDDKKNSGPDHPHSLNPSEFKEMVEQIKQIKTALGTGTKKVEKSEIDTRIIQRRSIFTTKEIKKGERFTLENIACLRPCIGLSASYFEKIINKKAQKTLRPHYALKKTDVKSL